MQLQMNNLRMRNQQPLALMMRQARKLLLSSRNSFPKRSEHHIRVAFSAWLMLPFWLQRSTRHSCRGSHFGFLMTLQYLDAPHPLCPLLQEQKKKELDELNAMLAEMGVAPKESDSETAGTAPAGKKKKKKDKAAVKDSSATIVNGNGVALAEHPKAEEPVSEQPQQESIEVLLHTACLHICMTLAAPASVAYLGQICCFVPSFLCLHTAHTVFICILWYCYCQPGSLLHVKRLLPLTTHTLHISGHFSTCSSQALCDVVCQDCKPVTADIAVDCMEVAMYASIKLFWWCRAVHCMMCTLEHDLHECAEVESSLGGQQIKPLRKLSVS